MQLATELTLHKNEGQEADCAQAGTSHRQGWLGNRMTARTKKATALFTDLERDTLLREMYSMIVQLTESQGREHDQFERAAVDQLLECFDTDCFTRRDVIDRCAIAPKLAEAMSMLGVDFADGDIAAHRLSYIFRDNLRGGISGNLKLEKADKGIWQFIPISLSPWDR